MAKRISSSDIFSEEDIFRGIRDSAEETIKMMELLRAEVEGTAQDLKKSIGGAKFDSVKSIENVVKVQEKANKLTKEAVQIDKAKSQADQQRIKAITELEKLEQQKINTESKSIRLARQKAQEQERINKQRQKAIKQTKDEGNAYKQLEVNTRALKNQSKTLGAEMLHLAQTGQKNTKAYKELEMQYKRVTKASQIGDAQLKKLDKTVGDNFRNVGNYKNALAGLKNGLGQLGLAFGIGQIAREGATAIIDFNQAVADLGAITGASGADLEFYKEQANEMGVGVEGGASAVVEAYKLIGSAKPELLQNAEALNELTKSAILLSQASGMELPEAAKQLTDAMNQFGAGADEAGKFIDVLASGAKFGSAEIPQITEALLKFGAIAKSTNITIQESTGAIELLAEKGLKGAEAGTKLRNVMLKLSAPDALPTEAKEIIEGLGISFEDISDQSKPFSERLEALKPLLADNAGMVKVFGMENVVAGNIVLENTDRLKELTEQMDTNGVATEQADKRTNTLGHALMELKNQFLKLFTTIGSGDGAFNGLISGIKTIGTYLPTIVSLVFKVAKAWLYYKGVLIGLQAIQKLRKTSLNEIGKSMARAIPMTKAYRLEQIKLARASKGVGEGAKKAGGAISGLGGAIAGLALGFVIDQVFKLAVNWYKVASGIAEAENQAKKKARAEKMRQKAIADGEAVATKVKNETIVLLEEEIKLIDQKARKLLALETSERKQKAIVEKAKADVIAQGNITRENLDDEIKGLEETQRLRKEELARKKALTFTGGYYLQGQYQLEFRQAEIMDTPATDKENKAIELLKESLKELDFTLEGYNIDLLELQKVDSSGLHSNHTDKVVKLKTELKEVNGYISKQMELLQKLKVIEQDRLLLTKEDEIENEYEAQLKNAEDNGKFEVELLNKLVQEKVALEIAGIDQRAEYERNKLDVEYERKKQDRLDSLNDQRDALVLGANGDAKALVEIEASYQVELGKLQDQEKSRAKDVQTAQTVITENAVNDRLEAQKKGYKEYSEMVEDGEEKISKSALEVRKENFAKIDDVVKASADYFIKQSERKIDQLNKEIDLAEKQADHLRVLAQNGNIDAEESLAEQQRLITEANKKIAQEEKKQQRIRLAQSVWSTYNSKVQSDSENPLGETIRDVGLLYTFINSLPAFFDGTEDTGVNGSGVDGKGGFQAILHPNERVIPKSLNDKIGGLSNAELTNIAVNYQNGVAVDGASQSSSALELALVVNGLKEIKDEIRNKPETSIALGEITSSLMEVVKTSKKGNSVTYNRFKIRK